MRLTGQEFRPQERLVGLDAGRRPGLDRARLGLEQGQSEVGNDLAGDLGLDAENIVHRELVDFRPKVGVIDDADELGRDPDSFDGPLSARPTDGSGEEILDPELAADFPGALVRAGVMGGARPGDDRQAAHRSEAPRDLVGDAVGEEGVVFGPQVFERQDGDPLGSGRSDRAASFIEDSVPH